MPKKYKARIVYMLGIIFISIVVVFISLCAGSADIPKEDIIALLLERIQGHVISTPEATILFNLRIPRIILGFMVGGALSLVGVIFQSLFRNPLVEPYTLGTSGGASLAVSLCVGFGISAHLGLPIAGFAGALLSIFLVYKIAGRWKGLKMTNLLLTGVMFSFICSSLIMLILSVGKAEDAHRILFWIMGNLEENNPVIIKLICFIIPLGVFISFFYALNLNALLLGEEDAMHLGVNTERVKKHLFIISSLLVGVAVSVSGIIGFVGLVVPHFMRMFFRSDHRMLMPASFLSGGIFLVLCDTIARTVIAPIELPVGVITGIVGGFIFIYFLARKEKVTWQK